MLRHRSVSAVAKSNPPNSYYMLHREIFLNLNATYGPFTLGAAADSNGYNAQCADFCSPAKSFLTTLATHHCVWWNPPFPQAADFLQHYLDCKAKSPTTTFAMFVLHSWPTAAWMPLTSTFRVIHTYPKGSNLFSIPTSPASPDRVNVGPTPWPVIIFYDPPAVDDPVQDRLLSHATASPSHHDHLQPCPPPPLKYDPYSPLEFVTTPLHHSTPQSIPPPPNPQSPPTSFPLTSLPPPPNLQSPPKLLSTPTPQDLVFCFSNSSPGTKGNKCCSDFGNLTLSLAQETCHFLLSPHFHSSPYSPKPPPQHHLTFTTPQPLSSPNLHFSHLITSVRDHHSNTTFASNNLPFRAPCHHSPYTI